MMGAKRIDRGRVQNRKRGAVAHGDLPPQYGPSADAEYAGEKSGQRADRDQQAREFEQFGDVQPCNEHSRPVSPVIASEAKQSSPKKSWLASSLRSSK